LNSLFNTKTAIYALYIANEPFIKSIRSISIESMSIRLFTMASPCQLHVCCIKWLTTCC